MTTAYLVLASITILANAVMAVADLAKAWFVLNNSAEVNVSASWVPCLGVLKLAGAAGLLLGLLGVPLIGTAAAIGLVAFFVGAIVAHLRARVLYNIAAPGVFLVLAAGTLALGAW